MNIQKRIALSLALPALLCLAAGAAGAATMTNGTFILPAQAYWGPTLLPAGAYSLSLIREQSGIELVRVQGEGVDAMVLAPAGSEETSGHSHLTVDDIGGTYVIRGLDTGVAGRAYAFGVSKTARQMTLRSSVSRPVTIPVSAGL